MTGLCFRWLNPAGSATIVPRDSMDCTDGRPSPGTSVWPGLLVALALGLLAAALVAMLACLPLTADLPLSMMMVALLLGLVLSPVASHRPRLSPGLELARGPLLKTAVILIGLRLSLVEVGQLGLMALPLVGLVIVAGLAVTLFLARLSGANRRLSVLLAVGTAICGASAIAATAPALNARREEICYAVACVTLVGLVATVVYPALLQILVGDPSTIGLVLGASIHDTAQVTAAASLHEQAWAAEGTLVAATVTKLLRNSAMIIVIPALVWLALRGEASGNRSVPVPLFIVGFIALSALRTLGDAAWGGDSAPWQWLIAAAGNLSTFAFAMALGALAMTIRLADLRRLGWKPALAAVISALLVFLVALAWVGMVRA
ncbi:MAG: putative sulfate exporter family transporter [Wenzhouxiangella sp.]|nr:MAG: putative sulfate exporter family transporter [Wenzhouxiangella sp.]